MVGVPSAFCRIAAVSMSIALPEVSYVRLLHAVYGMNSRKICAWRPSVVEDQMAMMQRMMMTVSRAKTLIQMVGGITLHFYHARRINFH